MQIYPFDLNYTTLGPGIYLYVNINNTFIFTERMVTWTKSRIIRVEKTLSGQKVG